MFKSTDRGGTWAPISHELTIPDQEMRSLAVSPVNSNYIYTANYSRMFVTTNGGESWIELTGSTLPTGITYIAAHPRDPRTLWVTLRGYRAGQKVFRSTDAGETWTNVSGILPNIPANCITIDPLSNDLYVGTDLGVFYSPSGNISWQSFDNGLPNVIVNELEIHINGNNIRAATFGRGLWESPLAVAPDIFSPLDLAGERRINRSLFQVEYIDVLTWRANPMNEPGKVVNYRIYQVADNAETLIETVSANTFQFYVRNVNNQIENLYSILSVDETGKESLKTYISVE